MIDPGDISYYLGIEVDYILGDKITLYQSTYSKIILNRFNMTDCKPIYLFINAKTANFLQPSSRTANPKTIK